MWISLVGMGLLLEGLIIAILFLVVLVVTTVILIVEKNKTKNSFRNLKVSRFFLANVFTGIFAILVISVSYQIQPVIYLMDHSSMFLIVVIAQYFIPFFVFVKIFKRPIGQIKEVNNANDKH